VTNEARVSFARAFGIEPVQQRLLEAKATELRVDTIRCDFIGPPLL